MLVDETTKRNYRKFRAASPFMLYGSNAAQAISSARILEQWESLEAEQLVKIEAQLDTDANASFYDSWEHLSERTREQLKEAYYQDCWTVAAYYQDESGSFEMIDSISGCSGYSDPCDPFENCYVIDMMESAIKAAQAHFYYI